MNVFGVGPLEMIVILLVGLIFVGPERLPRLAADIARTIREIRKYTGSLAAEFNDVIKDVEKETAGEKTIWKEVSEGIGGATQQMTEAVRTVRKDLNAANATSPPSANGAPVTAAPEAASSAQWVDIPDPDAGAAGASVEPPVPASTVDRAP
jgi:sec-independent protein translocase protein TatB